MAGFRLIARPGLIQSGTALKTLVQLLAPTNQKVRIHQFGVGFKGIVSTDVPVLIQLARQTTAGTPGGTGGALTLVKHNSLDTETARTTAQKARPDATGWTGEPTLGDIIWEFPVHPQSGVIYGPEPDWKYTMKADERIGLIITAAADVAAHSFLNIEE